ncbi:MAG: hypothetical protein ABIJ39_02275 [Chloroflexota bacterium]
MTPNKRLFAVILGALILALPGCNLPAPATEAKPSATAPGQSSGQDDPVQPGLGLYDESTFSPVYGIFVGMTQQGFCGPTTNSGWFASFDFDASFVNVRFVPPGPQVPFPPGGFFLEDSFMPLPSIQGMGEVVSYSICPDYDSEARANTVTMGPVPFQPVLEIFLGAEQDIAPVPLQGPGGEALVVRFDMNNAAPDGGSIMEWGSAIAIGKLGAPYSRFSVFFSVSWTQLMAGEAFEVGAISEDEGGREIWTMRFVPAAP